MTRIVGSQLAACIASLNLHSKSNKTSTRMAYSSEALKFCATLFRSGYISSYNIERDSHLHIGISVEYKFHANKKAFVEIVSLSVPGKRIFFSSADLKKVYCSRGINVAPSSVIIATSSGYQMLTRALITGLGGELVACIIE